LSETILAVELFVPKAGTFDDGVEYGLCLATGSTVVLLSIDFLRFTKGNGAIVNEMRFSPQPVYSIPTDNVEINCIRASVSAGRIFMGGKDGCLYEFFYQVYYKKLK
jgi:nuclear pore complex protein Nup155